MKTKFNIKQFNRKGILCKETNRIAHFRQLQELICFSYLFQHELFASLLSEFISFLEVKFKKMTLHTLKVFPLI